MKKNVSLQVKGSVRIRITGSFCERFLNLCAYHGIALRNLTPAPDGYEAVVSLPDFWKIKPWVKKSRIRVKVIERTGVPFLMQRYRNRQALFLSMAAAVFLLFFLSLFIWDIKINGNISVTDEKIMDYLLSEGIHQGIWKSSVDYKQLATDLREHFQEMTWVSVKLQGTRLVVDLQENTDTAMREDGEYDPSSLISNVDGTVVKIITRAGTPWVKEGDEIRKGDLLVSGQIDLVNDSGEVYGHQYVAADADIYVKTRVSYTNRIPLKQKVKVYTGKESSRHLLQFASLRIGLPFFLHSYREYDCIRTRKQLRVMENFYLPVFFSKITVREYEIQEQNCSKEQAKRLAQRNIDNFLQKFQEKGVQIFQNDVKIETTDSMCIARGTICIIDKAGKRVDTVWKDIQKEGTQTE